MSETKHTPEPRTMSAADYVGPVLSTGCGYSCIVRFDIGDLQVLADHRDQAIQLRAMAAAAPDMLEALTALLARFDDNPELSELIGRVEIERARAAIAKAEGRS